MGSTVLISKTKLIVLCVSGAVICSVVGIACWFGRVPGSTSSNASKSTQNREDFLPGTAPWLNLHLPAYTVPRHYDLVLYPDFYGTNSVFYGNVTIEIDIKQATWYLLVHIKDLNVKVKSVTNKLTKSSYGVSDQWEYDPNQFYVVKTKAVIEESATVLLELQFDGSLSNGIVGFYKAFYANNTKAMATSKFEPVDARKAFPCFDEPNLKATFTTTLIHKPDFTALSNMPVENAFQRPDQLNQTRFQKSVPMSTYLACFIVCKCTYKEKILSPSQKKFRVYAVEGSEDQIDYALDFGANVTEYFETYFGLEYPLPKMDMIAIPDFVSGAMEHWGLITYRETNLLYKEGVSSPSNKQRIAEVVAHELAHQWFGNIVTMDWWDDLWLNEGFATFMAYVGTDKFEPEMEVFSQFASIEAHTVMPEDSVASSHPIIVPVKRPEDISAVFDAISYNKGASVIRMLEAFIGAEIFGDGLKAYLKRYQYDNAKTYQLWESIGQHAKEWDIEVIMDTWTKQSGYPLITVAYDENTNNITASQMLCKDTAETIDWPTSIFDYKWEVPLHYITNSGGSDSTFPWIHHNSSTVEFVSPVDLKQAGNWLKFNKNNTGYYKVRYPQAWWEKLGTLLKNDIEALDAQDRAGLVYDAITLPPYGLMDYSVAFNFLNYLENEMHYVPWLSVRTNLFTIRDLLNDNSKWDRFVERLVKNTYDSLAWKEGGSHTDKLLKGSITRIACGHEYMECLNAANSKFTQWVNDPVNHPLEVTERYEVLTYGMKSITEEQWDTVWSRYSSEPVATAKTDMRRGLARTSNEVLINRYLSYALDKNKVADQDLPRVISYLAANSVARPIVWNWAKQRYTELRDRLGIDNRYFGRLVPGIASHFTTNEMLEEVEGFYALHPNAGAGKRAREQSIEAIKQAIGWKQRYENQVNDWLENNV
ncbi:hypothetical protein EB796_021664 [Bugula neritina]|uniref:Aminopeptidase n=1 Tax=Bugula neritina TaxID=10212 RepID=A0A7J7J2V0_BUGNE|nr:hypothetical protein EB796_021664 [Bugula neritina]